MVGAFAASLRNNSQLRGTRVASQVMICARASRLPAMIVFVCAFGVAAAAATLNGVLPGPLPLFPRTNWWNADI
jgi:hypothetical protein